LEIICGEEGDDALKGAVGVFLVPHPAVSHLPESWDRRVRKRWVGEGKSAVGSEETTLCKVE
jgi:hypothetical protein